MNRQRRGSGDAPRRLELPHLTAAAALALLLVAVPLWLLWRDGSRDHAASREPGFVGSASCRECHEAEYARWKGSHHERAMDVASDATVLGDFDDTSFTDRGLTSRFYRRDGRFYVETEGPEGTRGEFEVTHVFGLDPLQQYLIPFPGGRLQALSIAWDTREGRWFHLYPDAVIPPSDWLHWTRNAQNWNGMCAECHSTNLRKGYDPTTDTYDTTWSEISVGCEACHGPGSRHLAWARSPASARPELDDAGLVRRTSDIASERLVELCAPCHARRAELGDYDHTDAPLLDHMLPALLTEGLYHADGQQLDEVYKYASFLQSTMYAQGVSCADCHDSHSGRLLREGDALCLDCHQREVYDTPDHHYHDTGAPAGGVRCVQCHMLEQPYMVIDWRADHSFRVPRPDLSLEIGTPNACAQSGCHADESAAWAAEATRTWYGLERKPHFGTTFAAARAGLPRAETELQQLLDDPLQPGIVRATALELLSRYAGEAAGAALRAALVSDEPLLRHVAASAVSAPDPERVALLAPLLSDPVRAVRLDAVAALASVPRALLRPNQRPAFDAARADYEASMAHSFDFAFAAHNLGNLHANLGDVQEAERYYRRALTIDALFLPAKLNLAVLLSSQGRLGEAESLLRAAVSEYPEDGEAAYSLGLLLVENDEPEEALHALGRAVALQPDNPRAAYNLGLLQQQLGRIEEAEATLTAALAARPDDFDFLFALADHYLKRRRPEQALPLAERLRALRPHERAARELEAAARRALAGS